MPLKDRGTGGSRNSLFCEKIYEEKGEKKAMP
jgi:hypothetical protein